MQDSTGCNGLNALQPVAARAIVIVRLDYYASVGVPQLEWPT